MKDNSERSGWKRGDRRKIQRKPRFGRQRPAPAPPEPAPTSLMKDVERERAGRVGIRAICFASRYSASLEIAFRPSSRRIVSIHDLS
jgi:hypothetical protein